MCGCSGLTECVVGNGALPAHELEDGLRDLDPRHLLEGLAHLPDLVHVAVADQVVQVEAEDLGLGVDVAFHQLLENEQEIASLSTIDRGSFRF